MASDSVPRRRATDGRLRFHASDAAGHDDYLMSLALCCPAAELAAPPPESAIIPPRAEAYEWW